MQYVQYCSYYCYVCSCQSPGTFVQSLVPKAVIFTITLKQLSVFLRCIPAIKSFLQQATLLIVATYQLATYEYACSFPCFKVSQILQFPQSKCAQGGVSLFCDRRPAGMTQQLQAKLELSHATPEEKGEEFMANGRESQFQLLQCQIYIIVNITQLRPSCWVCYI